MIWVMVGIGGFTRETGSGLSIMNWDPIVGAIPPLTDAAWQRLFVLYQGIPQAQILHPGLGLAGFKVLFWPEYFHRLWGRFIGVAFFMPLVWFVVTKRVGPRLLGWLAVLFVMGALQGAIGWFMVASGFFKGSTAVEPWRLSLHFSFAMVLYVLVLWTALSVRWPQAAGYVGQAGLRVWAAVSAGLLAVTMFAGTFVSGTRAIKAFDPAHGVGVGMPPAGWPDVAFFSDKATILFNHQALAFCTTVAVLGTMTKALRGNAPGPLRDTGLAMAGLVVLQFTLGVTALVSKLLDVGVAHQMNAVLLLSACVVMLHQLRRAR
jgi:cytochrome c oxidase assembly protein subunit 15